MSVDLLGDVAAPEILVLAPLRSLSRPSRRESSCIGGMKLGADFIRMRLQLVGRFRVIVDHVLSKFLMSAACAHRRELSGLTSYMSVSAASSTKPLVDGELGGDRPGGSGHCVFDGADRFVLASGRGFVVRRP